MEAMAKGITPLPVNAEYFTKQIKEMADNVGTLDKVEDGVEIQGNKSELRELRDQLKSLANYAQHMKGDIEKKYANLIGGSC